MESPPVSDRFELRHAATDHVSLVTVPPRRLFAIDGYGPPRTPDFRLAFDALRAADEAVRAALAHTGSRELARPAAECIWRPGPEVEPDRLVESFATRTEWRWVQLLEVQPIATSAHALDAVDGVRRRAGRDRALIRVVELQELDALQILAVGGDEAETEALRRLLDAVSSGGLDRRGDIHQIFVADPTRVPDARGRSIIRIPVAPAIATADDG
jgi:hypothetical protein